MLFSPLVGQAATNFLLDINSITGSDARGSQKNCRLFKRRVWKRFFTQY